MVDGLVMLAAIALIYCVIHIITDTPKRDARKVHGERYLYQWLVVPPRGSFSYVAACNREEAIAIYAKEFGFEPKDVKKYCKITKLIYKKESR